MNIPIYRDEETCPKCGAHAMSPRYLPIDQIRLTCVKCGYETFRRPKDADFKIKVDE